MKIKDLIAKFPKNARVIKELIKSQYNVDFAWIFLNDNFDLDSKFMSKFNDFLAGTPLEYITNSVSFYGYDFYIESGVLIPRTETELLIDNILLLNLEKPRICEIGIGSGIISIILKKLIPNSTIFATDINPKAIEISRKNADKFCVELELVECNLIDDACGKFDIIVSNPPYISQNYKLDKWVLKEPQEALFGGIAGDEILKQIIKIASKRSDFLACEIGYDQKKSMQNELTLNGFEAKFYTDYSGFDRGFVARRL